LANRVNTRSPTLIRTVEPATLLCSIPRSLVPIHWAGCDSPATFRRTVGLYGTVGLTEDDARARFERARASFPGRAMRDETWETWRADTLSGSPEQVVERVRAFEALGVEELILSPWALPFAVIEPEIVDVFAEEVMPACR